MPREALALCARSDKKFGDQVVIPPTVVPEHRPCADCGEDLLVAPSTLKMAENPGLNVTFKCNPCGNAEVAVRGADKLGIAPGALPPTTPDNRRRRSELEAHGFKDVDPNSL